MRTTTKMLVAAAQNARKRDSRGRFTSEQGGGARMDGGYMNGGYRMDGGYESRINEPRNYGDNRRGETRNDGDYRPYMNDRGDDRRRNDDDNERTKNRMGGRAYDGMDEEENRIGFRTWPYMGSEHEHSNVVSYARHAGSQSKELTPEDADEWTRMLHNEDGTKGPHWTREQIKQVMAQTGVTGIEPAEFWAVMNALYSDYCKVAKKFNVDRPEFYAEMTKAWLNDKDAVDDKAGAYFNHIVKR